MPRLTSGAFAAGAGGAPAATTGTGWATGAAGAAAGTGAGAEGGAGGCERGEQKRSKAPSRTWWAASAYSRERWRQGGDCGRKVGLQSDGQQCSDNPSLGGSIQRQRDPTQPQRRNCCSVSKLIRMLRSQTPRGLLTETRGATAWPAWVLLFCLLVRNRVAGICMGRLPKSQRHQGRQQKDLSSVAAEKCEHSDIKGPWFEAETVFASRVLALHQGQDWGGQAATHQRGGRDHHGEILAPNWVRRPQLGRRRVIVLLCGCQQTHILPQSPDARRDSHAG